MKKFHPYLDLPDRNFWRQSISQRSPLALQDMYRKRFELKPKDRIAAAGSCFAQHIARRLKASGYAYIDAEPKPKLLPDALANTYGYGIYSARYGNIYTARQLVQLIRRAYGDFEPQERYWEKQGRFFDPFRPTLEPDGFASIEELEICRESHFARVRHLFDNTQVFIFTLGLTEAWVSKADGAVYPVCPGTQAGEFSYDAYEFKNFTHAEILADMTEAMRLLKARNGSMKFLFTVSPVPLVATATDAHVLVATTYSKSVLRAVVGELYDRHDDVDYFPSYEIVTAPVMRGMLFEPDMRSVAPQGVDIVMAHFFKEHNLNNGQGVADDEAQRFEKDVVCDEVILEADRAK